MRCLASMSQRADRRTSCARSGSEETDAMRTHSASSASSARASSRGTAPGAVAVVRGRSRSRAAADPVQAAGGPPTVPGLLLAAGPLVVAGGPPEDRTSDRGPFRGFATVSREPHRRRTPRHEGFRGAVSGPCVATVPHPAAPCPVPAYTAGWLSGRLPGYRPFMKGALWRRRTVASTVPCTARYSGFRGCGGRTVT